jgi:peptide/nickel transport system substrate-binding protein
MKWLSRTRTTAALLCGALVAAVSACGGSSDSASTGGTATAPNEATVAFSAKVVSLDPDQAYNQLDVSVLHLISGNLFEFRRGGEIVPGLAESATASADGLSWTFTLRPNLKFSDGTPLTSEDVKATFDRIMGDETNIYATLAARIDSVEATSATEIVVKLNAPYPSLTTVVSEPAFGIYPAGRITTDGFFDSPVSAGPYELVSWGGTENVVVKVNDSYWGPKPVIGTLTLRTIPDANTRLAQVRSGQIDFAVDLPPNLYSQITDSIHPQFTSLFGINALVPRNDHPPFDQLGMRQAVSKAVDRDQIAKTVFNDRLKPLAGFWPPTMTGYDESISTKRDVEGAKAALQGTTCETGCTVNLIYSVDIAFAPPQALIVKSNLEEIGITVNLEGLDTTSFTNRLFAGDFDLALSPQYDYVNIPDGMLTYALISDGGIQANGSGLVSAEIDEAAKVAMQSDGADRTAALANVEKLFAEQAPYANLTAYPILQATRLADDLMVLDSSGTLEIARSA